MIRFSIGICAYNEEKTVKKLLFFLSKENFIRCHLDEIIVVASGCTDQTEDKVKEGQQKDARIKLIIEPERRGKSSAVNLIITQSKNKRILLVGADVLPAKGSIEKPILALEKPDVGMVGGRVTPLDCPEGLAGYAVRLQWKLHHFVSLKEPKVGEMVAFKTVFKRINPKTAVDEAVIECLIAVQGYKIVYEPTAIVYNHGPKNLRDFLRQRRRIYAGHLATKKHYGYSVSTFNLWRLAPYTYQIFEPTWQFLLYVPCILVLELTARIFGSFDYYFNIRDHSVWKIAHSTKRLN